VYPPPSHEDFARIFLLWSAPIYGPNQSPFPPPIPPTNLLVCCPAFRSFFVPSSLRVPPVPPPPGSSRGGLAFSNPVSRSVLLLSFFGLFPLNVLSFFFRSTGFRTFFFFPRRGFPGPFHVFFEITPDLPIPPHPEFPCPNLVCPLPHTAIPASPPCTEVPSYPAPSAGLWWLRFSVRTTLSGFGNMPFFLVQDTQPHKIKNAVPLQFPTSGIVFSSSGENLLVWTSFPFCFRLYCTVLMARLLWFLQRAFSFPLSPLIVFFPVLWIPFFGFSPAEKEVAPLPIFLVSLLTVFLFLS